MWLTAGFLINLISIAKYISHIIMYVSIRDTMILF